MPSVWSTTHTCIVMHRVREREEREIEREAKRKRERGEKRETCQVHLHDRYTTSHRVEVEAKALLRARQATFDAGRRARAAEAPLSS